MIKAAAKSKKIYQILNIVLLLAVLFIILSGCSVLKKNQVSIGSETKAVKYTLHIGLNDKDTYKQEISDEKAIQAVSDISLKYTDGFTVYKCQGLYKDAKGEVTKENSLVLEFYGAEAENIKSIMEEVLVSLNQESILIEKEDVTYEFYSK